MPTFKPLIRTDQKLDDNSCNIKIRVTHNRQVRNIATQFYIYEENFDQASGKVIYHKGKLPEPPPGSKIKKISSQYEANRVNDEIMVQMAVMIDKCKKQKNIRYMDMSTLMGLLRDKRRQYDMLSMMDDRIKQFEQLGNINYRDSYKRTKGILEEFAGSIILFEAVDITWLKRLELHMRTMTVNKERENERIGLRTNSIGIHMRNIRTMYNMAIDNGLVEISRYPFRKYKIGREGTIKRSLMPQEIARIYRLQISDPMTAWARDMAILSFFLIGINMKDMMHLREIVDGRIEYVRSKGHRRYSIKIEPEALEIINRYRGSKYLLDTLEKRYSYYSYATKRIDKRLKIVALECKINKPVTTYFMRHSWATIARKHLNISKDDISMGLGHKKRSLEITEIYLDEDLEPIDNANRQIIDFIKELSKLPDQAPDKV